MAQHSKDQETPSHVFVGLFVFKKTRKKLLSVALHDSGVTISYDRCLRYIVSCFCWFVFKRTRKKLLSVFLHGSGLTISWRTLEISAWLIDAVRVLKKVHYALLPWRTGYSQQLPWPKSTLWPPSHVAIFSSAKSSDNFLSGMWLVYFIKWMWKEICCWWCYWWRLTDIG